MKIKCIICKYKEKFPSEKTEKKTSFHSFKLNGKEIVDGLRIYTMPDRYHSFHNIHQFPHLRWAGTAPMLLFLYHQQEGVHSLTSQLGLCFFTPLDSLAPRRTITTDLLLPDVSFPFPPPHLIFTLLRKYTGLRHTKTVKQTKKVLL